VSRTILLSSTFSSQEQSASPCAGLQYKNRGPCEFLRAATRSGNLALMARTRAREPRKTKYGHEVIGTVGDVDFTTHGGGEVYKTADGEHVLEWVNPPPDDLDFDDRNARWEIFRVNIDDGMPDWGSYKAAAKTSGQRPKELKDAFESENPMDRAWAFETWAGHYGWHELDSSPLVLDKKSIESRYDVELGSGDDEDDDDDEDEDEDEDEEERD
jgi:hypothetical protein